ncbi:MAG TPA: hypothetical protein VJN70_00390 [Gemmatimonadaceae bacterium]|nr:hypothetical protein [Gemmatimonadaceae bacterium]
MTIAFSPFLTADVDENFGRWAHWSPPIDGERSDSLSIRLELIRRRVVAGYYASPEMATDVARRIVQRDALSEY